MKIDVLDKGYVILHETMGSDLSVVNAARVSYDRKKEILDDKDIRLIKFLAREGHTSPFRHVTLQFEVYAPLMVARQWWKHVVGGNHIMDSWNESSRRYITEEAEFYIPGPTEWRSKPENSKQGSGEPVDAATGEFYFNELWRTAKRGEQLYEQAMEDGIAPEQARLFLPANGLYVRWYWTASLQSVAHFLSLRLEQDAQKEIQDYAKAVHDLSIDKFPNTLGELIK